MQMQIAMYPLKGGGAIRAGQWVGTATYKNSGLQVGCIQPYILCTLYSV